MRFPKSLISTVECTWSNLLDGQVSGLTVQICNSCTSRPDVCQCLVVQKPMDNMSKHKPNISMTDVACESKLQFRHSIPAPVDRTSVRAWLYKHPRMYVCMYVSLLTRLEDIKGTKLGIRSNNKGLHDGPTKSANKQESKKEK